MTALVALCLAASSAPGVAWMGPPPPAHPRRVATLAPSLTETVLALGAGDRLVGVSRYDDAPEVAKLPRLGGMLDPSPEAVLAVRADLLLIQPSPASKEIAVRLAALGVPVLALSMASLGEVMAAERAVGAALGEPERGEALAAALAAHVAAAAGRAAKLAHPAVLLVYGWDPLVVAGPGSFADELIRAAGGKNAARAAKTAYAVYSVEAAAAARPDLLIDATFDEPMPPALRSLPGFAQARVVRPKSLSLLHPGPRLGEALDELFAALHPAEQASREAR